MKGGLNTSAHDNGNSKRIIPVIPEKGKKIENTDETRQKK